MKHIQIEELSTPEAFVMRRIIQDVGLNIRPEKAEFDEQTRTWTVRLKAMVPSQVTSNDKKTIRTFLYRFENIGSAKLKKVGDEFKFIEFPYVDNIDEELHNQWYDLTEKVEQEILRVGSSIWGELVYVQMLLRPMYTIIGEMITGRKLYSSELLKNPQQLKYAEFLKSNGYLDFKDDKTYIASGLLTQMAERLYSKYDDAGSDFIVTSKIIGGVFSKHYREIKNTLGAHAPSVYVDTSMAYYLDAIRTGESIRMSIKELWRKYRMIGHRNVTAEIGSGYPAVIAEIVLGKLLDKQDDTQEIYANETVFKQLAPFGHDIATQLVEIP